MKNRADVEAKFDRLSYKKKCEVLEVALDIMQAYNGRSKEACIRIATEQLYEKV